MSFPAVRWRPGRSLRPTLATYRWRNMIHMLTSSEAPEWAYSAFHMLFVSAIQPSLFMFLTQSTYRVSVHACSIKKSVLYICTLIARHHRHQLIAVSLIRRSCHSTDGGFRKLRQSSFLVVPPGCSNSQNYTIVLRRRLPPCCVSHSAYVITRHNYDDSNRICLLHSHSVYATS